jgi:hypothetical protein
MRARAANARRAIVSPHPAIRLSSSQVILLLFETRHDPLPKGNFPSMTR